MSEQLWPCSGYSRHVKRGDPTCPFCGVESPVRPLVPTARARAENETIRTPASRLSRAALFAGTVGAAIGVTDCANSIVPYGQAPNEPPNDASMTRIAADSSADADGSPSSSLPADASDASDSASSPTPVPTPQPAYGAPVPVYGGSPIPVDRD
jgi:hypothetical protein